MEVGDGYDTVEVHTALAELVAQDPRCFYRMVDACLRRHASEGNTEKLFQDMAHFIHPSAAAVLRKQQAPDASEGSSSSSKARIQGQSNTTTASSSTGGGPGAGTGGWLLTNWKQTQAFLSALLSYRKVLVLLRDSMPPSELWQMEKGVRDILLWLNEEGVLDAVEELGIGGEEAGKKSISSGGAGGGKAKAASSNSAAYLGEGGADPEEAAACRMVALCVLSRVLITFCQQLAGVGSKGSRGSSKSPASGGGDTSSKVADLSEQLKQIDFTEGKMGKKLRVACSLGVACYCLVKQVQQYGSSNSRSSGKGGSSSSSRIAGSGASQSGGSSTKGNSKGSSSSKGGGQSAATTASSSSSVGSQNWGRLQLELPSSVLEGLHKLETTETYDTLQGVCAVAKAVHNNNVELEGETFVLLGEPDYEGMVQLLEQLLGLCEGVVAAVPVPLGCNNPSCTSLDGVSEASAAKVCSGCKKAHYCGTACVKAHWKEHKPYCK